MFFTIRKTWFVFELFTERFFGEPKMVLLRHHYENPLKLRGCLRFFVEPLMSIKNLYFLKCKDKCL